MGDIAQVNPSMSGFVKDAGQQLMTQAYTNQNWLQFSPDVLKPSVDFSDKKILGKALENFEKKPLFVMGGYRQQDAFYNPVGIQINKALGK